MTSISDFVTTFNNPIIYVNEADDSATLINDLFSSYGVTASIQAPPATASVANLDAFLNGNDIVIIGGPIANSAAATLQTSLQSELVAAGLSSLVFATSNGLDGTTSGDTAPDLSLTNSNGTFDFGRSQDVNDTIADHAIVVRLQGTTNNLLYIAGIRDFGTAVACHILYWIQQDPNTWPTTYGDVTTLTDWQTLFSSTNAALIQFYIPQDMDTTDLSVFIPNIFVNGVGGPPSRDIGPTVGAGTFAVPQIASAPTGTISVTKILANPVNVIVGPNPVTIGIGVGISAVDPDTKQNAAAIISSVTLTFSLNSQNQSWTVTPVGNPNPILSGGAETILLFNVTIPAGTLPGVVTVSCSVKTVVSAPNNAGSNTGTFTISGFPLSTTLVNSVTGSTSYHQDGTLITPIRNLSPEIFPGGQFLITATVLNSSASDVMGALAMQIVFTNSQATDVSSSFTQNSFSLVSGTTIPPGQTALVQATYTLASNSNITGSINAAIFLGGRDETAQNTPAVTSDPNNPLTKSNIITIAAAAAQPLIASFSAQSLDATFFAGTFAPLGIIFNLGGNSAVTDIAWSIDFSIGGVSKNQFFTVVLGDSSNALSPNAYYSFPLAKVQLYGLGPAPTPAGTYTVTLTYNGNVYDLVNNTSTPIGQHQITTTWTIVAGPQINDIDNTAFSVLFLQPRTNWTVLSYTTTAPTRFATVVITVTNPFSGNLVVTRFSATCDAFFTNPITEPFRESLPITIGPGQNQQMEYAYQISNTTDVPEAVYPIKYVISGYYSNGNNVNLPFSVPATDPTANTIP